VFVQTNRAAREFTQAPRYQELLATARDWRGPLFVVFGEGDPFREAWQAPAAAAFPNAQLTTETVPDAGHHPWVIDPTLIDRMRAFILDAGPGEHAFACSPGRGQAACR
jgi:pimeloyl-ACP methyl ester carboxylesterase